MRISDVALLGTAALLLAACGKSLPKQTEPLTQWGYLWQRDWSPAVSSAVQEAGAHLDGVVVLGAEINWEEGKPRVIEATISWPDLQRLGKPCGVALRIAPYPGPFAERDAAIDAVVTEAKTLLQEARAHGVTLAEFEIDFDCAQGKLAGYDLWLRRLAQEIHPVSLVITALPSWLDEAGFAALVGDTDGYVLQVHSVPTLAESGRTVLCDPILAQKWVTRASRVGRPFSVALPTYWCLAGYNPAGALIDVAMDSVQPAWPPGTKTLEFETNANEMASLVLQWQTSRPAGMQRLLWYRVPVSTDRRNWRWPTLAAVMQGREPTHRLRVVQEGDSPVDFSIRNDGEAEEKLDCDLVVEWSGGMPIACDALPGWTVAPDEGKAVFTTERDFRLRLSPGSNLAVGWMRFEKTPALRNEIVPHGSIAP